jgi:hypothetical protein
MFAEDHVSQIRQASQLTALISANRPTLGMPKFLEEIANDVEGGGPSSGLGKPTHIVKLHPR